MPNRIQFVVAGSILIVAHEMGARRFRKKAEANKFAAMLLLEQNATFRKQIEYLSTKLAENGVELNEFDLIALNNMVE